MTQDAIDAISGSGDPGVPAADAHEVAGITYRQLDYWARQGWVRPSLDEGQGRAGRRRYALPDVIRLDLLRHLAQSGMNMSIVGKLVADLTMPQPNEIVIYGPIGVRGAEPDFTVLAEDDVRTIAVAIGAWVIYTPSDAIERYRVAAKIPAPIAAAPQKARRSA